MARRILVLPLILVFLAALFAPRLSEQYSLQDQKSMELVGVDAARLEGLEGQGVKVGIIDTGIDYQHPDLLGYGPSGKIIGGYNYMNPSQKPLDTDGHGTEVAGIIAADGKFTGIAPKAKLLAYKVSSTGEDVSSNFIVSAIKRAMEDGVNVINISLGVNRTNYMIDDAIDQAVKRGIVVVVAAGNNGPQNDSIGSPGRDFNAITVGASYNNVTSSLVATFEVGGKKYNVLPMVGSAGLHGPLKGHIVYGGYGRAEDLKNIDVKNSILLEERGSDVKGQKVYFAEKEKNAADHGAKALVIFNNETGNFLGELVVPNSTSSYAPRIPVISMSQQDGLALKSKIDPSTIGRLDVFYHPDFAAPFSSEGPVSPFYIKPDLVAPGVFINSTTLGGKYNLTSGTSFSAPHVAGAAAIILQKYPWMSPADVASLLVTTTDPVTDAYGNPFPISLVGSGRLNITRALDSKIIFSPHSLVFNLSLDNTSEVKTLHIMTVDSSPIPKLRVSFHSSEPGLSFSSTQFNDTLKVKISQNKVSEGSYDGFLILSDSRTQYRIPVITHVTNGTLIVRQKNGTLYFSLDYPGRWTYAKIFLTEAGTDNTKSTAITPDHARSLAAYEKGNYWIIAQIASSNRTDEAYQTVMVGKPAEINPIDLQNIGVPSREAGTISAIAVAVVAAGLGARRMKS